MINKLKKLISSFFIETAYISPKTTKLSDHVVLITGANRGMGYSIAQVLEREGASLVLVSRNIKKAQIDSQFNSKQTLIIDADITQEKDVDRIVQETMAKFGKIDVLINCAGQFIDKPLEEISVKEYESVMGSNVKGMFIMSSSVIPFMKKQKDGLIINIGSKISHNTNVAPDKVLYATSKYAVEGFSFALNRELKKDGIRVVCLMPGTVSTFVSLQSKKFLSPFDVASLVTMIIKFKNIDFESIVFKSKKQDI